jgi:predicted ATP-grasp superfamily ATP-dependent carboligase
LKKNLNYISHLKTSISILEKQAMETQHNIEDMKEQLELELERERNEK